MDKTNIIIIICIAIIGGLIAFIGGVICADNIAIGIPICIIGGLIGAMSGLIGAKLEEA